MVFGSAGNANAIRTQRGKSHGIAYHITPQTGIGSDHHSVIFKQFHIGQTHYFLIRRAKSIHWNKFVENAVVQHQQQIVRII